MSGGAYGYADNNLLCELFGWSTDGEYAPKNPYKDWAVSQLMYDLLKLTHELDWSESGDTGDDVYTKHLVDFKSKWLNTKCEDVFKGIINYKVDELKEELLQTISTTRGDKNVSEN